MPWWNTGFPGDENDKFISRFESLTVELVPESCWYSNLRNLIPKSTWNDVRREVLKRAGHRCEMCGEREARLDCHEIWRYEDGKQILDDIAALCRACHRVKHAGLAQVQGKMNKVYQQLMEVNNWDEGHARQYVERAFTEWAEQSTKHWELDRKSFREKMLDLRVDFGL